MIFLFILLSGKYFPPFPNLTQKFYKFVLSTLPPLSDRVCVKVLTDFPFSVTVVMNQGHTTLDIGSCNAWVGGRCVKLPTESTYLIVPSFLLVFISFVSNTK